LTLVCSIGNINIYDWAVPGLVGGSEGLTRVDDPATTRLPMGQTFILVANRINQTATSSTLRFAIFNLWHERNITCQDAERQLTITDFQVISCLRS